MSSPLLPLGVESEDSFRSSLAQALRTLAARGILLGGSSWKYPGRRAELEKRIAYIFVNNRLEGNSPETMMAVADLLLAD